MFKLMIQGNSVKDLTSQMQKFIEELQPSSPSHVSQEKVEEVPEFIKNLTQPVKEADVPHVYPPKVAPSVQTTSVLIPKVSGTVENDYGLDTNGMPWDERIHAVTQGKNKDGSWRYRRGVEDPQIKQVEAELKNTPVKHNNVVTSIPAIPTSPVIQEAPPVLHNIIQPVQPVQAPIPPTPAPSTVPTHSFETFKKNLIPTLAHLVNIKKLEQTYVNTLCKHYGVDMLHKVNDQQLEEIFNCFIEYKMIVRA